MPFIRKVQSYLYYKIVDPYLWTELAPVLEGSGSRRRHTRKGTSVDRVCVVIGAPVDRVCVVIGAPVDRVCVVIGAPVDRVCVVIGAPVDRVCVVIGAPVDRVCVVIGAPVDRVCVVIGAPVDRVCVVIGAPVDQNGLMARSLKVTPRHLNNIVSVSRMARPDTILRAAYQTHTLSAY